RSEPQRARARARVPEAQVRELRAESEAELVVAQVVRRARVEVLASDQHERGRGLESAHADGAQAARDVRLDTLHPEDDGGAGESLGGSVRAPFQALAILPQGLGVWAIAGGDRSLDERPERRAAAHERVPYPALQQLGSERAENIPGLRGSARGPRREDFGREHGLAFSRTLGDGFGRGSNQACEAARA